MKTSPCPNNPLLVSVSLLAAMCLSLAAQSSTVGSSDFEPNLTDLGDTNELTAAIAEEQKHIVQPDPSAMRLFVNAPDAAARQAAAERARQAALASRQSVREEIELLSEGAIARFGPHQVTFPNRMPGVISLRTPDGLLLQSRVLGLAYLSDSGKSVLLAELKPSVAELLDEKTVIFRDVLDGADADLIFEYGRTFFEQSLVVRRQLPTPEEAGFSADEVGNVRLAVMTEWFHAPQPRKVARIISLREAYQALGIQREETLIDEQLGFGAMRMVEGKSFALGEPDLSVPTGKTWETLLGPQGEPVQFLIEGTPYRLLKPLLDALPVRTASISPREPQSLHAALQGLKAPPLTPALSPSDGARESNEPRSSALMAKATAPLDAEPGVVLDYLIVNTPLLNVEFVYAGKLGSAAAGYDPFDYWNAYNFEGYSTGWLANMYWSDWNQSSVGLVVSNAPGVGLNSFCLDPMYQYFIHPTNGGQITVTITNLPADEYDLVVYGTRASEAGAPMLELRRGGTSLWHKGTTLWGRGWYSTLWDEGEQYVRFRNIAVNNQTITLDMHPDAAGYAAISGIQIVPSSAIPSEQPVITKLLNVDFGGTGSPYKVGFGAVGLTASDFWNGDYHPGNGAVTLANLKWSDQTVSSVGMAVVNGPGCWGNSLPDPMFLSYMYAWDGGNISITLTDLPAGICDIYLYGHTPVADDNAVFELWSDDVNWGTKGTSLIGDGPTYATWEVGQQYVLFKDVTVAAGKPVIVQAKHTTYGYNNVSGMQIAYTGAVDTDADGLPDGWERRSFNNLDQIANADADSDGLTNLREYQLGTDPARADSNANSLSDLNDFEKVWMEDGTPQGGYEMGDNEGWNWVSYWYDGDGWGGEEVYPHSGRWWDPLMHVSENVPGDLHQHYFWASIATMRPQAGDVLYTYINLDSSYPPSEVMLQWYVVGEDGNGSWEHRAYWGADLIDAGQNGTASRYPVGALPTAGQWVRLEVLASAVGLEGKIVEGMTFTLHGGRAAWDSAGTIKPDHDGDGLLDAWEIQYFGNLLQNATGDNDGDGLNNLGEYQHGTNPTNRDTDSDGLWDSEEMSILVDVANPGLGYLNPLIADTGGTGKLDGQKDTDHDGLSNSAELRNYLSDPSNAHTYDGYYFDSEYFHSARVRLAGPPPPPEQTLAEAVQVNLGGGLLQFTISDAPAHAQYDLYFVNNVLAERWQWRRVLSGIQCDGNGTATFKLVQPDPTAGFFEILSAEDQDEDGLSDGYEAWFHYNGLRTGVNDQFTDLDQMKDGWEVEYGLNPMKPVVITPLDPDGGSVDRWS